MAKLIVERASSLEGVAPEAWDALVGAGCPFFEHGFLSSLEDSGCVGPHTGWRPRYLIARRGQTPVGALPLFRKEDSYGEFIFDWAWANAAHQAGLPYYPKLVVAAPFSPVGGPRFLIPDGEGDDVRDALLDAAREVTVEEPATGLHWLFITEREAAFLASRGFAIRHTHQFQWTNPGYADFEDFLARFSSKRRNQIRRERKQLRALGVRTRILEGGAIGEAEIEHMWAFYRSTVDRYFHGRRYLNRAFFDLVRARLSHRLMLVLAEQGGEVIGGALNLLKGDQLYGRYWGSRRGVRHLHFEVCSYASIEAAIARGIRRFEPGAGGGAHKFGRGFLPTITRSAHEIYLPGLDEAVRRFLEVERAQLDQELARLEGAVLKA